MHCGDNLPILREMADNSVDAIVTDPPYGLSFMNKRWDYDVPSVELWAECLRVLKPGGHLLAFAGTRTQHRMAVRIEDAGFEIRDMIAWVYGSGFPKSTDIGKAIDKAAGAVREVVGKSARPSGLHRGKIADYSPSNADDFEPAITAPATDAAKQWDGWGSALKPALEPITVARKPLAERTIAANVLEWGTGGVNVDGCKVGTEPLMIKGHKSAKGFAGDSPPDSTGSHKWNGNPDRKSLGRFPANFIHDGHDEVMSRFPMTVDGSAARFFYCAKASRSEREAGCDGLDEQEKKTLNDYTLPSEGRSAPKCGSPSRNHHPTVKPIALMRYLCRLVTPPNGIVLDPFTGSGTTGCAATLEGFGFVGIEREAEYAEIARRRVEHWREVANQDEGIIEDVQEKLFAGIG